MRKQSLLPLLLLALLFCFGCTRQHKYITPAGQEIETSAIGLQTLAVRDQNIEVNKSFNEAIKGASDFQSFALTVNRLTQKGQQIEREPTVSEEGRAWAGLFLRYFGGGWFNNRKSDTKVKSYVINGNNNSMSGIETQATSYEGDVTQSLASTSTPYEYTENHSWTQQETQSSANGASSTEQNTEVAEQ